MPEINEERIAGVVYRTNLVGHLPTIDQGWAANTIQVTPIPRREERPGRPAAQEHPTTRYGDIKNSNMEINYILKEDGFHRETRNSEFIGTYDQLIAEMSDDTGQFIKNVGDVRGSKIHMFAAPSKTVMCIKISKIVFNTYFSIYRDARNVERLIPVFHSNYSSLTIKKEVIWRIPDNSPTYFIMVIPKQPSSGNKYLCFLVSKVEGDLRKLYLPNIHTNGKICMGNGWCPEDYHKTPLLSQFNRSFEHFINAGWNRDLYEEHMQGCIIFDDNFNQVDPTTNVLECMPIISNSSFEILRYVD